MFVCENEHKVLCTPQALVFSAGFHIQNREKLEEFPSQLQCRVETGETASLAFSTAKMKKDTSLPTCKSL